LSPVALLLHVQVPSFTSTKLLWLQRHEPQIWAQLASVLLPHDYMNFWLTGKKVTEVRQHGTCRGLHTHSVTISHNDKGSTIRSVELMCCLTTVFATSNVSNSKLMLICAAAFASITGW
jgi:hypothetical protein